MTSNGITAISSLLVEAVLVELETLAEHLIHDEQNRDEHRGHAIAYACAIFRKRLKLEKR